MHLQGLAVRILAFLPKPSQIVLVVDSSSLKLLVPALEEERKLLFITVVARWRRRLLHNCHGLAILCVLQLQI